MEQFGQKPAKHHRLIIDEIEKVALGETRRLMINLPPGSAKSTFTSHIAPAWLLAQRPNMNIIGASHTIKLAEDVSRRIHNYIRGNESVLGYSLENESAGLWFTNNGGRYLSAGVGAAISGYRADCVTGDTQVITKNGQIAIRDVQIGTESGIVLSYEGRTDRLVFRRVIAKAARTTAAYYRVCCASGAVVEATGDHRFLTEGGWKPAKFLSTGEVLLRVVQGGSVPPCGRHAEGDFGRRDGVLLLEKLSDEAIQSEGWQATAQMQGLRRSDGGVQARDWEGPSCLLGQVPSGGCLNAWREVPEPGFGRAPMRDLRVTIPTSHDYEDSQVLQQAVQRQGPFKGHFGSEESWLAAWLGDGSRKFSGVVCCEADHLGARRHEVRGVQLGRHLGCPPHQHDPYGSSAGELGGSLSWMPSEVPCGGAFRAASDTVAVVERVCDPTDVYDIQVEGTQCFFANGVLVHNCVILDDPVASREKADSEIERDKAWNWYLADLRTRMKPDARIILVMTRWHEDDLGGRLLQDSQSDWRVLKVPAIAGDNDPLDREPGDWLWDDDPDYSYGQELRRVYAEYERSGAMRDWYALYQQDPRPMDGSIFKPGNIATIPAAPAGGKVVRAWDLAATEKTGTRDPDWTTGVKLARMDDGSYVVQDIVRFQGGPDEVERTIVNTAKQDGRSVTVGLPQDPGQAGKMQVLYLTRKLAGYKVETSTESGDKATRAAPVASQVNVGNVRIVAASWNKPFLEELRSFPSGTHDDIVDSFSRAFGMLIAPPAPAYRARVKIGMR